MFKAHTENTFFKKPRTPHFLRRLIVAVLVCVCVCGGVWGDQTWDASTTNIGNLSTSETITLSSDVTLSGNLNWFPVSDDNLLVIELKGYTLKAATFNLGPSVAADGNMGFPPKMKIIGPGTLEVSTFDSNQTQNCSLTMEKNVLFTVTGTFWGNMDPGKSTKIEGDESCSIKMPAEIKVNSGVNRIEITDEVEVTTKAGDYEFIISPGLISGGTSEVTVTNTTTAFSSIKYSISSGSNLVSFDGVSASNGTLTWATAAKEQTFSINIAALTTDQTISMEFKDATGSTVLKSLKYEYKKPAAGTPSTSTAWTGAAGDGKWSNAANWSEGIPSSTTYKVTIPYVAGKDTVTVDNAVQINNLTVNVSPGVTLKVANRFECSSVRNSGTIELAANQTMSVTGYFRNYGTLKLNSGAITVRTLENGSSSTIEYAYAYPTLFWPEYNELIISGPLTLGAGTSWTVSKAKKITFKTAVINTGAMNLTSDEIVFEQSVTNGASGSIATSGILSFYNGIESSQGIISCTGEIHLSGTAAQNVNISATSTIGDVVVDAGAKPTLIGDLTCAGLTIEVTGSLDISNKVLTVTGDLINSGTLTATSGTIGFSGAEAHSFTSESTVTVGTLSVAAPVTVAVTGGATFGTLSYSTGGSISTSDSSYYTVTGSVSSAGDIFGGTAHWTFTDDFSGTGSLSSAAGGEMTFVKNFSNTGTIALNGTTTFSGSSAQSITAGTTHQFANVTVSGAGGLSLQSDCSFSKLTVTNGDIALGSHTLTVTGDWTHSGGNITASTGGTAVCNGTMTVSASVSIAGDNTWNNLTCTTAGTTITFAGGSTQTVNGTLMLTGTSASAIALVSSDTATPWILAMGSTPSTTNLKLSYATVSYSTASPDISTIIDVAGTTVSEGTAETTTGWFKVITTYTWDNASGDGNWTNKANWLKGAGRAPSAPAASNTELEIIIAADLTLAQNVQVQKFTVNAAKELTAGDYTVSAGTTTINGTFITNGTNQNQLPAATTWGTGSIIIYTGIADAQDYVTGADTIKVEKSGGTFTFAGGLLIAAGESVNLAAGTVSVTGNVSVAATGSLVTGDSVPLTVTGNWTNNGTFTAGSGSTVTFAPAAPAKTATITGSNIWQNLTCTTAGATLQFAAGSTQTVNGILNLAGVSENPIMVQSATPGTAFTLEVADDTEKFKAEYVTFKDCSSTNELFGLTGTGCVDGGNTTNIFSTAYFWTGAVDSSWDTAGNWKIGSKIPVVAPSEKNTELSITVKADSNGNALSLPSVVTIKTFTVSAGNTISVTDQSLSASSEISNQGTMILSGGSVNTTAFTNNGTVELSGGTLTTNTSLTNNGTLSIAGGVLAGSGTKANGTDSTVHYTTAVDKAADLIWGNDYENVIFDNLTYFAGLESLTVNQTCIPAIGFEVSYAGTLGLGKTTTVTVKTSAPAAPETRRMKFKSLGLVMNAGNTISNGVSISGDGMTLGAGPSLNWSSAAAEFSFTYTLPSGDENSVLNVSFVRPGTTIVIDTLLYYAKTTFTGGDDGNWNTSGNWNHGIPSEGTKYAEIAAGKTATLQTSVALPDLNLTVAASAVINLNNNNLTAKAITNNGTLQAVGTETIIATKTNGPSSTVSYTGSSASTSVWGNDYANLTTATGTTFTADGNLTVTGTLNAGGTMRFTGTTAQTVTLPVDTVLKDVEIANTTGMSFSGNVSCASLTIVSGGRFTPAANTVLTVTGNWTNNGTFTAGSGSTVTFAPAAADKTATITGSNIWQNLTCTTPGAIVKFDAGSMQTVKEKLTVNGQAPGTPVQLVSTVTGAQWTLDVPASLASFAVANVSVKDSISVNLLADILDSSVVNAGNTKRWFGATYTWVGSTDSKWTTAGNWREEGNAVATSPNPRSSKILIEIATDPSGHDLDVSGNLGNGITDLLLNAVTVKAGKALILGSTKVTAQEITINGTVRSFGDVDGQLTATGASGLSWGPASIIEYYGTAASAQDYLTGANVVKVNKTGGTFTFRNGLSIPAGKSVNLASGTVSVTGDVDIQSAGSLVTGTSVPLTVTGNWINNGTFTAGSGSTVTFTPAAADRTVIVTGDNTWQNLTCTVPGTTVKFAGGSTQTVKGILTIAGSSTNDTILDSTNSSVWTLVMPAANINQDHIKISYVTVHNSTADPDISEVIDVTGTTVKEGLNTLGWFIGMGPGGLIKILWAYAPIGEKKLVVAFDKPVETSVSGIEQAFRFAGSDGSAPVEITGIASSSVTDSGCELVFSLASAVTMEHLTSYAVTTVRDRHILATVHSPGEKPATLEREQRKVLLPLVTAGVEPVLAYDNRTQTDLSAVTEGSTGSIRLFDGSGSTMNSLLAGNDITLQSRLDTGVLGSDCTVKLFVSTDETLRNSLQTRTAAFGSGFIQAAGNRLLTSVLQPTSVSGKNRNFIIPSALTRETGKNLILFFGFTNASGTVLTNADGIPLYGIRALNGDAATGIDVWSVALKEITQQDGGVTILNNVINVLKGEETVIEVEVTARSPLTVQVLTLDGNVVTTLQRGTKTPGKYYFRWNGTNKNGAPVARGMYFIRVTGGDFDATRKVMVIRE